jgi:hypothetical protein
MRKVLLGLVLGMGALVLASEAKASVPAAVQTATTKAVGYRGYGYRGGYGRRFYGGYRDYGYRGPYARRFWGYGYSPRYSWSELNPQPLPPRTAAGLLVR